MTGQDRIEREKDVTRRMWPKVSDVHAPDWEISSGVWLEVISQSLILPGAATSH